MTTEEMENPDAIHHLPRLAVLCQNIADIVTGEAVEAVMNAKLQPESGVLVVLPSWVWRVPRINVGRKGRASDGTLQTMPARIVWDKSPIRVLSPDAAPEIPWRVTGMGHNETGTSRVLLTGDNGVQLVPQPDGELSPLRWTFSSNRQFHRVARGLVKNGREARWRIVASLETFTRSKLAHANSSVAAELGAHYHYAIASVLDDISLDDLLGQMLYGEGGSSVITRMVDRGLSPDTFNRVDPMRYFSVGIRARAEEAVRRRIGDPKVGPKVRRVFARSNAQNIDELLAAYRKVHPQDSLARKRAIAALTAGADIAVHQKMFRDEISASPVVKS